MFLQWKLTLPKHKFKFIIIILIATVGVLGFFQLISNSCTVRHVSLLDDIKKYEQTTDPEMCDSILERIEEFNDDCKIQLEAIDCG